MRIIFSCFVLLLAFAAANTALAQRETANGVEIEKDLALLRRNIRAEKKQLIAANMVLRRTQPDFDRRSDEQHDQAMGRDSDLKRPVQYRERSAAVAHSTNQPSDFSARHSD